MSLLVLDASAGVDLLLSSEEGERVARRVAEAELHTVAHFDAEVFSALARLHRGGVLDAPQVAARLDLLASFDVTRAAVSPHMLRDAWALREHVAARDALYVVLARHLGARLVTTDRRLAWAVPDLVDR